MLAKPASPATRRRRPKPQTGLPPGRYRLKALNRALDVLEYFNERQPKHSLKDISQLARMPESSLFRILLTLKQRGYLQQNPDGTYQLPPQLAYAQLYRRAEQLKEVARPHLAALSARFEETASLAMLFVDEIRVLDTVETFREIRMVNRPGRVLPPHSSSLGKAITAFQPPDLIDRILEVYGLHKRTEHSIVDRGALAEEYAAVRQRGYAFDREETVLGGMCIGVPVRLDGQVRAAISISLPVIRSNPEQEAAMIEALQSQAQALEQDCTAGHLLSRG